MTIQTVCNDESDYSENSPHSKTPSPHSPEKINVLITAASRRVSLVRSFRVALQKVQANVITVDYDVHSPALFFSDKHYKVPLVNDPEYLSTIDCICAKENVGVIIPTIDQELQIWADNKDAFADKNIAVIISPPDTVAICNDKFSTHQFFKSQGLPFPGTYLPQHLSYRMNFPLFIKPRQGRGSIMSFKVNNKRELDFFVDYVPDPVVQDYLDGKEFTVDAYFSRDHRLINFVARYRLVIRSGVSDRGRTFKDPELSRLIRVIADKMKFSGPINIQGKINKNEITFFEINPRFSGGIQLTIAAGQNYAEYILRERLGETLEPRIEDYSDNLTMTSYEDSLFIDSRRNVRFFYARHADILPTQNKTKL